MKIVCFLLKLMLKILLLPVAFLLRFLCFIWNLLMQLSLWVLSPIMLFVLGCGIYSVVRASWTDVFLLTLIEMGLFAAAVGAGGIMELMEMVGGSESNVWKLYENIMCVYFDMEEIIKQAVYLQGAYDRERMLK